MNEVSKRRLLDQETERWPNTPINFQDVQYVDCRILPDANNQFIFGYANSYDSGSWTSVSNSRIEMANGQYRLGMNDIISRSYDQRTVMTLTFDYTGINPDDRSFSLYLERPELISYTLFSVSQLEYIDQYTFCGTLTKSSVGDTFLYINYEGNVQYPLYQGNVTIQQWSEFNNTEHKVYIQYLPLSKILRIWIPTLETISKPYDPYQDEPRIIEDKNLDNYV